MTEDKEILPELVKDLGMRFPTELSKQRRRYGLYRCKYCGNLFEALVNSIKKGNTKSCGCLRGEAHRLTNHPLFNIWRAMISRCESPNNKAFKNYGGRGITVCERWKNPINFVEDMFPSFKKGLTLDRINVDGNYELKNCRWVDRNTQAQNTRKIMSTNRSGYRGVSWHKSVGKWISKIALNNKSNHLGCFTSSEEAARAYDKYIIDNNLAHTKNFDY